MVGLKQAERETKILKDLAIPLKRHSGMLIFLRDDFTDEGIKYIISSKKSYFELLFGDVKHNITCGYLWNKRVMQLNKWVFFVEGEVNFSISAKGVVGCLKCEMDIPEHAEWFDGRSIVVYKQNKLLRKIFGINYFPEIGCFWEIPGMTHEKWLKLVDSECIGGISKNQPEHYKCGRRMWKNPMSH